MLNIYKKANRLIAPTVENSIYTKYTDLIFFLMKSVFLFKKKIVLIFVFFFFFYKAKHLEYLKKH